MNTADFNKFNTELKNLEKATVEIDEDDNNNNLKTGNEIMILKKIIGKQKLQETQRQAKQTAIANAIKMKKIEI